MITLEDNEATDQGMMVGELPDEFELLICPGHYLNRMRPFKANPLGEDHLWVCYECDRPTRVALVNCIFCETWHYETLYIHTVNRPGDFNSPRVNYICKECNG